MLKQKMKIAGACLGGICLAVAMTGTALAATYTITYDASTDGQGLFLPENTEILTQTKESGETVKISDRTPAGKDMGHLVAIGLDTCGGVLLSGTSNFQYIYGTRSYFDKWTDDREGNGNVYTAGQDYMKDANLTLYAQWKYVRKDESTPLPDVKRDGYELLGWYDSYENGNFLGMPGDEVELENLSVIYARWSDGSSSTNPPAANSNAIEPSTPGGSSASNSGSHSGNSNTNTNTNTNTNSGDEGQSDVAPNDDIVEVVINADKSVKLTATNTGLATTADPTVTIPAKDGAVDVEAVKAQLTAWHVDLTAEKNAEALAALESPDASGTIDFYRDGAVDPVSENANDNNGEGGDVEQGMAGEQPTAAANGAGTPIANVGGQAPAKTEKLSATVDASSVLLSVIVIAAIGAIGTGIARRR